MEAFWVVLHSAKSRQGCNDSKTWRHELRWKAPKKGRLKLNFNGSSKSKSRCPDHEFLMGRKCKRKSACLVGASCAASSTTPLSATESEPQNLKSSSSSSIWTPPKKGLLKLNFNGTSKSRRSSIGGVYRDHNGKFVLGYTQQIGRATICMTELVALKRGLELAVDNGWRDISIEGDFKGAIDAMAGDCAKASGAMVRSKKDMDQYTEIAMMLSQLGKTSVSHVLREGNMVANGFAKLGHKAVTLQLWRDIPPEEILEHLEKDATELRERDDEQRCLVSASCKTAPMNSVAATECKPQDLKIGSSSSIWTAPNEGRLKLNFDGSSKGKSRSKRSSIGGVYRDHNGKFILGYAEGIGRTTSSVAEFVALKRGLELAVKNGWRDISIEGDFKSAIDTIASHAPLWAKKDLEQYMEIATMLPLLGNTTVSHVLRKGNRVANGFVELGHEADTLRLWHHIPPNKVLKHLEEDAQKYITPLG